MRMRHALQQAQFLRNRGRLDGDRVSSWPDNDQSTCYPERWKFRLRKCGNCALGKRLLAKIQGSIAENPMVKLREPGK